MAWGSLCQTGEELCSLGLTSCQAGFAWELGGWSVEGGGCLRCVGPAWHRIEEFPTDPVLAGRAGVGGVPKVVSPPFCPVPWCQLGFGGGDLPWQCLGRRPCLTMPVESRSAGTPSHRLPAPELRHATGAAPVSKTEEGGETKGRKTHLPRAAKWGPMSPVGSTLL